jgi:very-short-patch-repair endonuclease
VSDAIDAQLRAAVARAIAEPAHPVAVLVTPGAARRWRAGRRDRLAAMVDEGWLAVPEAAAGAPRVWPGTGGGVHASGVLDDGVGGDERGGGGGGDGGDAHGAYRGDAGGQAGGDGNGGGEHARGGAGCGTAGRDRAFHVDARSLAEATLFEALEATPATAGRFRLNESLAVRFGPIAAEVDLLSRGDRIAIEIDGVHHFADPDCYRRDRKKDLLLQTHGFVVVRLLAEDVVRDVRAAVTAVSQALAYRLGEGPG